MKKYKQLALKQRYQIQCLLQAGFTQIKTASIEGVHRSTISRELKRNIPKQGRTVNQYVAEHVQLKTNTRHISKHKQVLLTAQLKQGIKSLLEYEKWSTELIVKRLKLEGESCVSHETIYKWIWHCKHSNHREHKAYKKICEHLKHNGRRQKRRNIKENRGAITGRVPISQRPKVAENSYRIGDIEVGLMMGSNHKFALLVLTDRKTLIIMIEKPQHKNVEEVYHKIKSRLTNFKNS